MKEQVAIVTGSSSGFGLLTAIEFAKRGFSVIATVRSVDRAKNLISHAEREGCMKHIHVLELDVTSRESLSNFHHFVNNLEQIDVLVNNAGFAGAGFVEEIPVEEYRQQFETNVFGLISVTQACLPKMREAGQGKIINVSSISGLIGFPGLSPYVASKHALEGFSESLRLEMKPFGIYVSLVEPGSFNTNIWSTGKRVTENSLKEGSPYFSYMKSLETHILEGEGKLGDPQIVANKMVEIALHPRPKLRYPIGKGVHLSIILKRILSWESWEKLLFKKMR
jgi:NAD(P)-dependent dehydrogenase (short-subunit alcohol dehydrogenase family)